MLQHIALSDKAKLVLACAICKWTEKLPAEQAAFLHRAHSCIGVKRERLLAV
jgi:hypothetical protein